MERRVRIVVVILIFLAIVELGALIALVPSLLLAQSKEENVIRELGTVENLIAQREQDAVAATVRTTREQLKVLTDITTTERVTSYIDLLVEQGGSTITLTHFEYQEVEEQEEEQPETSEGEEAPETVPADGVLPVAEMTIRGVAQTREALLDFVKRIEREAIFTGVDLPVSNLAERANIAFNLELTVIPAPGN